MEKLSQESSPPHRVGFYPCCCDDIEEPRRFLAPLVDEILFCDLKRAGIWDVIHEESGLPKATFLQGDARVLIPTLPPLTVLFYRNDSSGDGGSGLKIVGKVMLKEILQRFDPEGGWIFSDGANGGKEFRSMLSADWRPKPRYGFQFRRAEGYAILNREGHPLGAVEVRPIHPAAARYTRPGWVPPRDLVFNTIASLWDYCVSENRIVPKPDAWNRLYGILRNTRQKPSGGWEPPLPLILGAWNHSSPIEKQLRFKEHLEWAEQQDQMQEVAVFLRSLSENQWCHWGEV